MSHDRSVSSFDPAAVPIRGASTVMLVRDSARGVEVFLQQRVVGMDFAGGMTVFPGGGVDPSDTDASVRWSGPDVAWWAERFATDEATARALVLAAVRETFEECGVLLAGPDTDTLVADTAVYAGARRKLEARELSFGDFLAREGLVLRADLLRPWANWITPLGERRRYDTRFFVAAAPDGQRADGETSEADEVRWRTAAEELEYWRSGRCVLLPPTWTQLTDLARYRTVAEIMAAEVTVEPVLPVMSKRDGMIHISFDGEDGYYAVGSHPWAQRADL
ncbi:NUDIX domain-containing protein [Rhodococcus sp. (in: high G+C Gram-positive bacteria)]|uniref:NUDIX hydrolase n=1 Tax=Rhodococcus sp. TaxID=1831 RepID=UPI0019E9176D|nr:NUDIX domain-containing protein [Rhodococcus sp. (in: high G+C Gram-positive bacteria)]MBF0662652.1 NUDIX domain-containing protein [Rhodococcus sp. (in: high G+C Gram-positive bacteria)]